MRNLLEIVGSCNIRSLNHLDRCDLLLLEVKATDPAVAALAEGMRLLREELDILEREQSAELKQAIDALAEREKEHEVLMSELQGILETVIKKLDPDEIDSTPVRSIASHIKSVHDLVNEALSRIEGA